MIKNEYGDEYPNEVADSFEERINQLGQKLVSQYKKYIYLDGRYGSNSYVAGEFARNFPASITGTDARRFRNKQSYEANKVDIEYEGKKFVVFLSPTHGGINIFDDWIPYSH